jgi:hypothetical protein
VGASGRFIAKAKPAASEHFPGRPIRTFLSTLGIDSATSFPQRFDPSALNQRFDWNVSGGLRADDATLSHTCAAAPATHVNGEFAFEDRRLRTRGDVQVQWGRSPGRVRGFVEWTPEGYGRAVFSAAFPQVALEEWLTGWGGPDEGPPEPVDWRLLAPAEFQNAMESKEGVRFEVDGALACDEAAFRRFRLSEGSAHFLYRSRAELPDSIRFDRIRAGGFYGGTAEGTAAVLFVPKAQWRSEVRLRDVLCGPMLEAARGAKSTVSGRLSAQAVLEGRAGRRESVVGSGSFALSASRFLQNPILAALGRALSFRELTDVSFTTVRSDFSVARDAVDLKDLELSGSLIRLEGSGRAGLDGTLDLTLINRFLGPFETVVKRIPILKVVPKIINEVGQVLLKAHVGGTTQDPAVTLVPFSADELKIPKFKRGK